jgi:hypothetical protein
MTIGRMLLVVTILGAACAGESVSMREAALSSLPSCGEVGLAGRNVLVDDLGSLLLVIEDGSPVCVGDEEEVADALDRSPEPDLEGTPLPATHGQDGKEVPGTPLPSLLD